MIASGTVLGGKYIVERVLGEGGMGIVVSAKHVQLGQRVAIKMMLAEGTKNADALARFEREARAAAELASDHVARVTDVGHFDDGSPYMVMEYLEGEDLAARIQREGPLPVGDVIRLFIQACIGLGDAHEHAIVHRDIKPANLFLAARRGGRTTLKVLDFGIAKANLASSDHNLTRTSAMMGSPQYMSPEQLRDTKNVDARTDIWSLGASVYEALTGAPAFPAETLAELHVKILMEQPVPTYRYRPEVPLELDDIVMRCLAKQPGDRFRTMLELQHALEQAERALAVPRVAFQSNPAFVDTAVPDTAAAPDGAASGDARRYAGDFHQSRPSVAPPSAELGARGSVQATGAEPTARTFAPALGTTDVTAARTMGDHAPSSPSAKRPIGFLVAGGVALLVAGATAQRVMQAGASSVTPASSPASASPGSIAPAPVVERVAPAVPPVVEPAAPAVPAVVEPAAPAVPAVVEPAAPAVPAVVTGSAADSVTAAGPLGTASVVAPATAAPEAPPAPVRGSKRGAKGSNAPTSRSPVAAPTEAAPAPKPKKKSALDVDLD